MTLFRSSSQRVRLSEPLHNITTFPWAGWVSVFPERQSAGGQREGRMRGGNAEKIVEYLEKMDIQRNSSGWRRHLKRGRES